MENESKKRTVYTIAISQKLVDKAKRDSVRVLGRENISGYIQYLIQNAKHSNNG